MAVPATTGFTTFELSQSVVCRQGAVWIVISDLSTDADATVVPYVNWTDGATPPESSFYEAQSLGPLSGPPGQKFAPVSGLPAFGDNLLGNLVVRGHGFVAAPGSLVSGGGQPVDLNLPRPLDLQAVGGGNVALSWQPPQLGEPVQEVEPNDSVATAQPVNFDQEIIASAKVSDPGAPLSNIGIAQDLYQLTVTEPGPLTVDLVEDGQKDFDIYLLVASVPSDAGVVAQSAGDCGAHELITVGVLAAGTYLLAVVAFDNPGCSPSQTTPYRLRLSRTVLTRYNVYMGTSQTFTPSAQNFIGSVPGGFSSAVVRNVPANRYFRLTSVKDGKQSKPTNGVGVVACQALSLEDCPGDIVQVLPNPGPCQVPVTYQPPVVTGGCGVGTVACEPPSGSTFQSGVTLVVCTANDMAGFTETCSFTVRLVDPQAPSIVCPDPVILRRVGDGDFVTYDIPTVQDNCNFSLRCTPVWGSFFPLGTTTVTCTARDRGGNVATCSFPVIITVPGADTAGLYNPSTGAWFQRDSNSGGAAGNAFFYGPGGAFVPLRGDWDGDGDDTPGVYDPATGGFFLKNSSASGPADLTFVYGAGGQGLVPVTGDFNGDGIDTIGLYDPMAGAFFLKNSNTGGNADNVFFFGPSNSQLVPLFGDWTGSGFDTVCLYDPATGAFFVKFNNTNGAANLTFFFGVGGAQIVPVAGDWDGDGYTTIGVHDRSNGAFFLKNTLGGGDADLTYFFGTGGGLRPIVGDWDGQ